jgi:hypothetical protein
VKGAFCNDSQSENTLNDVYRLYTGVNTTPGDDSVVFLPNCSIYKENDSYVATTDSSKYTVLQQEVRSVPTQENTSQHGENSGAQSQPDNISTLQPSEDAQNRLDSSARHISSTNDSPRLHTNSNSPHDIEQNLENHTICTNNASNGSQSCGPQTTPDSTPQVNTVGSEQSPSTSPFIMQVDDIPQGIVLLYPNGLVFRLRRDPSSSKFHTHVCINFINGHKHSSIINFACYKVTIMGKVLFASSREQLSELKTCVISS